MVATAAVSPPVSAITQDRSSAPYSANTSPMDNHEPMAWVPGIMPVSVAETIKSTGMKAYAQEGAVRRGGYERNHATADTATTIDVTRK